MGSTIENEAKVFARTATKIDASDYCAFKPNHFDRLTDQHIFIGWAINP